MDYYIKELKDKEFMSHDWESLMFLLSIALSFIYIDTILHDILLCQSGQGYGYLWLHMVTFARTSIFWKVFDFDGSLHGEMGSLYHVIEKT